MVFIVDGDDTLWRNNAYYEEATRIAIEYLVREDGIDEAVLITKIRELEERAAREDTYTWETHLKILGKQFSAAMPATVEKQIQEVLAMIRVPEVYSWTFPLLTALYQKGDIFLHTRGTQLETENKLHHTGIKRFIRRAYYSRKTIDELSTIVSSLGEKKDILVIGDSLKYDIEPAHALSISSVLIQNNETWNGGDVPSSCIPLLVMQ